MKDDTIKGPTCMPNNSLMRITRQALAVNLVKTQRELHNIYIFNFSSIFSVYYIFRSRQEKPCNLFVADGTPRDKVRRDHYRRSKKSSMKKENCGTIKSMQKLYKMWPHNGFKVAHVTQKRHKKQREIYERFSIPKKIHRLYTPTIHWNSGKIVEIFSGTILRLLLIAGDRWICRKSSEECQRMHFIYFTAIRTR